MTGGIQTRESMNQNLHRKAGLEFERRCGNVLPLIRL